MISEFISNQFWKVKSHLADNVCFCYVGPVCNKEQQILSILRKNKQILRTSTAYLF